MSRSTFTPITAILALLLPSLVLLLGIYLSPLFSNNSPNSTFGILKPITPRPTSLVQGVQWLFNPASLRSSITPPLPIPSLSMVNQTQVTAPRRGDVYFISHGGPPTIEQHHSGPYKAWQKFGRMINSETLKPKGIIAVSAHWENEDQHGPGSAGVIVNSNTANPLIYDFGGFPKHFYQFQFRSFADPTLQARIVETLKQDGIPVRREDRGPDHGVWIPFKAAFGDDSPLPIVQVSLPGTSDPLASVKLGRSLGRLRDEGYAVVATGQVVHNLRDLFTGRKTPYTKPFMHSLESALSAPASASPGVSGSGAVESTVDLLRSPLYKQAHPTDEHFFPILVALGAVHHPIDDANANANANGNSEGQGKGPTDVREKIYTGIVGIDGNDSNDIGLGWGMWRWSQAETSA